VHKYQQIHGAWDIRGDEDSHREKFFQSRERFLTSVQNRPTLSQEQLIALNREWSSYDFMKGVFE
jgi:hypothetical protein